MPATKRQKYRLAQMRAAGISPWTDAEIVRAHIRMLLDAGGNLNVIAARAGVSELAVRHILRGAGKRPPTVRTRRETALAILAVTVADLTAAPAGLVSACGTKRRLQALMARGWSQERIADGLGMGAGHVRFIMDAAVVQARTARRVRALYRELWDREPPAGTKWERAAATKARQYAAGRGWALPAEWDDDIDDPAATPVSCRRDGRPLRGAASAAEALELFGLGLTHEAVAERMDTTPGALERMLCRQGCYVSRRAS